MDLEALVTETLVRSSRSSPAALDFLDGKGPRYAVGRNLEALNLHRLSRLNGIIDDFYDQGPEWHGIPVVRTTDVPGKAWIVNCSTSISPVAVRRHLARSRFAHVVELHEVVANARGSLNWPTFVTAQRKEIHEHLDDWIALLQSLSDEASRQTFLDVLRY